MIMVSILYHLMVLWAIINKSSSLNASNPWSWWWEVRDLLWRWSWLETDKPLTAERSTRRWCWCHWLEDQQYVGHILPQNQSQQNSAFNPIKRPNCPFKTKYKHHREDRASRGGCLSVFGDFASLWATVWWVFGDKMPGGENSFWFVDHVLPNSDSIQINAIYPTGREL